MYCAYILDSKSHRRQNWTDMLTKLNCQVEPWSESVTFSAKKTCKSWLNQHNLEYCVVLIHAHEWWDGNEGFRDSESSNFLKSLANEHMKCLFVLYNGADFNLIPEFDSPNIANIINVGCNVSQVRNVFVTNNIIKMSLIEKIDKWLNSFV